MASDSPFAQHEAVVTVVHILRGSSSEDQEHLLALLKASHEDPVQAGFNWLHACGSFRIDCSARYGSLHFPALQRQDQCMFLAGILWHAVGSSSVPAPLSNNAAHTSKIRVCLSYVFVGTCSFLRDNVEGKCCQLALSDDTELRAHSQSLISRFALSSSWQARTRLRTLRSESPHALTRQDTSSPLDLLCHLAQQRWGVLVQ